MDSIDRPPVIASASNSFSFDFSSSNFSLPPNLRLSDMSSSNTTDQHDAPEAQAGSQPTAANSLANATHHSVPAPVLGTAASSISPPLPAKAQTDENGDPSVTHPPLRDAIATSSIGLKPQEFRSQEGMAVLPFCNVDASSFTAPSDASLQSQGKEHISPPSVTSTRIRGKKRKTIPVGDTATPPEPKKPRALSTKQKGKQKAIQLTEVANDNQVTAIFNW